MSIAALADTDEFVFAPEAELSEPQEHFKAWRIAIVDDDEDVHTSTELALKSTLILGRKLEFLHAHSAVEAEALLRREADIAVVLLDVVMESESAGLKLVHTIREELKLAETRIVLRTGQPGYAPEIRAIREYDINDYKTKSELTHTRLYTTLTVAIRSYDQIRAINASRQGLDLIVRASSELMELHGLQGFASGVITQIAALLRLPPEGLICAQEAGAGDDTLRIIAAGGKYDALINRPLKDIPDSAVRAQLDRAFFTGENLFDTRATTLVLAGTGRRIAVYLETQRRIDEIDRHLLEVFATNIAVGFENTALFAKLHSLAYFDPLTGLPNRLRFLQELERRIHGDKRVSMTAVLADIDGFAETNDALGHQFGDLLLCAVAERLRETLPSAFIARVAGDTFGLVGPAGVIKPSTLGAVFDEAFHVDGQDLNLTATHGYVNLAEFDGSGADVLKSANIALKRAKSRNRGEHSYFTREMDVEIRERVKLLHALRQAFDNERLSLMYQPQVSLPGAHPVGLEALIRWRGEDGRYVPPDRFIPIAEHSGLILSIGQWVLRMACHQQARLAQAGFPQLRMAINVSLAQFRSAQFVDLVAQAIHDSGARAEMIELEITESMAMEEPEQLINQIARLHTLGVRIAIDDFGTGFSSLSHLQQLKVDRLKIDQSFVRGLITDPRGRDIPDMVIQLGRRLDLAVIAEGVETPEQAQLLGAMGCNEAQGYYFARPMEQAQLDQWLTERRA